MILDIMCLAIGGYGFYWGYNKGILKTLLLIVIYLFMLVVAVRFAPFTIDLFEELFHSQSPLLYLLGFGATVVAAFYISRWLNDKMKGIFDSKSPNSIHQIGGGAICGWFFLLLYSISVWFFYESRIISTNTIKDSVTFRYTKQIPEQAKYLVKKGSPYLGEVWDKTIIAVQSLKAKGQMDSFPKEERKSNYRQKQSKQSNEM